MSNCHWSPRRRPRRSLHETGASMRIDVRFLCQVHHAILPGCLARPSPGTSETTSARPRHTGTTAAPQGVRRVSSAGRRPRGRFPEGWAHDLPLDQPAREAPGRTVEESAGADAPRRAALPHDRCAPRPLLPGASVVFAVDGGPWYGPVSWRNPVTFGTVLLLVFAADCAVEVGGITLQAWRRVPSH